MENKAQIEPNHVTPTSPNVSQTETTVQQVIVAKKKKVEEATSELNVSTPTRDLQVPTDDKQDMKHNDLTKADTNVQKEDKNNTTTEPKIESAPVNLK